MKRYKIVMEETISDDKKHPWGKNKEVIIGEAIIKKIDWLHKGDIFMFLRPNEKENFKFFFIGQALKEK